MLCFLIGDHSSAAFRFLLIISSHIKPWLGIPDSNFTAGLTLFFLLIIEHRLYLPLRYCDIGFACLFVGCFLEVGGETCSDYVWSRVWLATFNERIHRCKKTTYLLISVR